MQVYPAGPGPPHQITKTWFNCRAPKRGFSNIFPFFKHYVWPEPKGLPREGREGLWGQTEELITWSSVGNSCQGKKTGCEPGPEGWGAGAKETTRLEPQPSRPASDRAGLQPHSSTSKFSALSLLPFPVHGGISGNIFCRIMRAVWYHGLGARQVVLNPDSAYTTTDKRVR